MASMSAIAQGTGIFFALLEAPRAMVDADYECRPDKECFRVSVISCSSRTLSARPNTPPPPATGCTWCGDWQPG